jgi:hypothetical protein
MRPATRVRSTTGWTTKKLRPWEGLEVWALLGPCPVCTADTGQPCHRIPSRPGYGQMPTPLKRRHTGRRQTTAEDSE